MGSVLETTMMLLILSDMALLGLSRLRTCIAVASFQGMLLGVFTLLAHEQALTPRIFLIAAVSFILKGFVFPQLLRRSIREASAQNEMDPYVGYSMSVMAGMAMLGAALWLGSQLPLTLAAGMHLVIPAALTTVLTGLFLIIARKNALSQCLGFIILENGIYAIGIVSVVEISVLVEIGILLDAAVAVVVMGVAIFHINRQFDHLDTDQLDSLKG